MGAEYAEAIGLGRNVNEAFVAVVREAEYWNGHGGYTGSMAEKHEAVLCGTLPPRMSSDKFSTLVYRYMEWKNMNGYANKKPGVWVEHRRVECPEHIQLWVDYEEAKPKHLSVNTYRRYYGSPRYDKWLNSRPSYDCEHDNCKLYQGKYDKTIRHRTSPIPKNLRDDQRFIKMLEQFIEISHGSKWGPAAAVQLNTAERAKLIKGKRGLKRGTQAFLFEGYCSS